MRQQIQHSLYAGIDLGTTTTQIGIIDNLGPKVIPGLGGEFSTPTVVYISPDGKEILAGPAAWNMQMLAPQNTFREFKRDMGANPVYAKIGGKDITPKLLSACQLQHGSLALDECFGRREKRHVVITVPADFKENERQNTRQAGEQAGFEVIGLMNEPTAAAIAFCVLQPGGDEKLAVIDVGGGTTDVTIAKQEGSEIQVLATRGDKHLGGADVDTAMLAWVSDAMEKQLRIKFTAAAYPAEYFSALEEIRRAKHMLSAKQEAKIALRVETHALQLQLSRDQLAVLIRAQLEKIKDLILTTEAESGVKREELKILLVGGSSRLVAVRDLVKGIFGEDRIVGGKVGADQAVCLGATIHCQKLAAESGKVLVDEHFELIPEPHIKCEDVTAHGLGVAVSLNGNGDRRMSEILARNTPIPCKAAKTYGSVTDEQTEFLVEVLQGREGQTVGECLIVASKQMQFPARSSAKPSMDITMGYDRNNMCHVVVFDRVSKRSEEITVQFNQKTNGGK